MAVIMQKIIGLYKMQNDCVILKTTPPLFTTSNIDFEDPCTL